MDFTPSFASRLFPKQLLIIAVLAMLVVGWQSLAGAALDQQEEEQQVCDPLADYFLGLEDYPEAIRLHLKVLERDPTNPLAHYHLGYAYGMTGQRSEELAQYEEAVELGLTDWDLFLNLGLLYQEIGRLQDAIYAFQTAAILDPSRSEPHFNLGLVYERLGRLNDALQEMLVAEELDPKDPDVSNMLGVIYAEMGHYARAEQEWTELLESNPTYEPARLNLARLKAKLAQSIPSEKAITAAKIIQSNTR